LRLVNIWTSHLPSVSCLDQPSRNPMSHHEHRRTGRINAHLGATILVDVIAPQAAR